MLAREQIAAKIFDANRRYLLSPRENFDGLTQPEKDLYLDEADYWLTKPVSEYPWFDQNTGNAKAPRLSKDDKENCRKLYPDKSIKELAAMYDVCYQTMHSIVVPRSEAAREKRKSRDRIKSKDGSKICIDCPKQIVNNASRCNTCAQLYIKNRTVKFPELSELKRMVAEHGLRGTGRRLNCSKSAIVKKIEREERALR